MNSLPRSKNSLVLVTGASGFVGQQLCRTLLAAGYRVRACVRRQAQASRLPSRAEPFQTPDIGPETDWRQALAEVEIIVHLAGVAHRWNRPGLAEELFRVNTKGTEKLAADAALSGHVQRLVFLSSVGAMTDRCELPLTEESPCRPVSDYGRSKLEAETRLCQALEGSPTEWVILRPPLVYGPGNPGNMARLMKLMKWPLPLPFGSIQNRRSFLFVGNLTDAILRCAEDPAAAGEVFLVSDGQDLSTPDLIRSIGRLSGREKRLLPFPRSALAVVAWLLDQWGRLAGRSGPSWHEAVEKLWGSMVIDPSKLKTRLQWQPPHSVEEGLRVTLEGAAG